MKRRHMAIMVTSALAAGFVIYLVKKSKTQTTRLARVADEGYETAEDILYPLRHNRKKRKTGR